MHELYVTESLLNTVLHEAKKVKATRVRAINLKIGEFSGIEEECIRFFFEIISKETPAHGAKLNISYERAKFKCSVCKREFERIAFRFSCPACGACGLLTEGAGGLLIESIEVE